MRICLIDSLQFYRWQIRPTVVVLDNLREGGPAPDIYDSSLNPLYRDV